MEHRRQVSKEEIEQARELDLLTYLQMYEPHELVRLSSAVYSLRSHDSLKISNGKWYQWSTGIGGISALDYLVKVQGEDFVSSVLRVLECLHHVEPTKIYSMKRAKPTDFKLPTPNTNNDKVFSYLMSRGLSEDLLKTCADAGLLYEDTRHNCVFIGSDTDNVPRYAMLRSSDPNSTFLREAESSDKRHSFCLPMNGSTILYVFESAIDCLSFVDLQRMDNANWKPDNYLSLSGVFKPRKDQKTELPVALDEYLKNNQNIRHIILCLDNDDAGINAAIAICSALPREYSAELLPPEVGKDYNEQLMIRKHIETPVKTRGVNIAHMKTMEEIER